jgi:hypothetical protein
MVETQIMGCVNVLSFRKMRIFALDQTQIQSVICRREIAE